MKMYFPKKEKEVRFEKDTHLMNTWIFVVSVALIALFASIVFNAFFLFNVEKASTSVAANAISSSPGTIDLNQLQMILADHDARLAAFPSEKSAALALPDPSK